MRAQSWFDDEKLFDGEMLIRQGPARLRTAAPPYWWEGTLVLTSDRLFFLPFIDNPLQGDVAFWLSDVDAQPAGTNMLRVRGRGLEAVFKLRGFRLNPVGMAGARATAWQRAIAGARRGARTAPAFTSDTPRAAAG